MRAEGDIARVVMARMSLAMKRIYGETNPRRNENRWLPRAAILDTARPGEIAGARPPYRE
jgi:hypothetical protein